MKLDWNTRDPFPRKTEGLYLVWLSDGGSNRGNMRTASVFKIANGTMCCVGDHWYSDVIGGDCCILAWLKQPAGPLLAPGVAADEN